MTDEQKAELRGWQALVNDVSQATGIADLGSHSSRHDCAGCRILNLAKSWAEKYVTLRLLAEAYGMDP